MTDLTLDERLEWLLNLDTADVEKLSASFSKECTAQIARFGLAFMAISREYRPHLTDEEWDQMEALANKATAMYVAKTITQ